MKLPLAKLNHLGDTLLLTPTVHFLKERYPNARIDLRRVPLKKTSLSVGMIQARA